MTVIKLANCKQPQEVRNQEKDGYKSQPKIKHVNHSNRNFNFNNHFKNQSLKQNRLVANRIRINAESFSSSSFLNSKFGQIDEQIYSAYDLDSQVISEDFNENENFQGKNRKQENRTNKTFKGQNKQLKNLVRILLLFLVASSSAWMLNKVGRPVFQTNSINQNNNNNNINSGQLQEVQVVVIVPKGGVSELGVPWSEVMEHTAKRIKWAQEGLNLNLFVEDECDLTTLRNSVLSADVVVTVQIQNKEIVQLIQNSEQEIKTFLSLDSSSELQQMTKLGDFYPNKQQNQLFQQILNLFLSEQQKKDQKLFNTIQDFWQRKSSDDILYLFLVLINQYVKEVSLVSGVIRDPDSDSLKCMIDNCRQEIFNCVINQQCRSALGCLGECAPTDQICAYRCLASYETPQLEQFSLCILQKHNCLNNKAEIQQEPEVTVLRKFRGEDLTHETAENIFIGYFGEEKFSWRVVAGKNPAYDYFPCQFQIFYRGQAKNTMWYDPVFKVETIDGRQVWRKRHYRVRRQKTPGKFRFSVLDNGVTSLEDWTIVDCNDDLDWCLFYYSGAASAAGISYVGAIFATRSGEWPSMGDDLRINAAFEKCGIKLWELSMVNNQNCGGAPLTPVALPA